MFSIAELPGMFAARNTGQPALIDPVAGVTRTYGQLAARTEQLTAALFEVLGVTRGSRIAALSRNSIELTELYLASARAGALLFPLNWRFSPEQVADALRDAAPTVVFYESEFADVVDQLRTQVDTVWVDWSTGRDSAYEELLARVAPRVDVIAKAFPEPRSVLFDPFVAISTGGTSGIPKSAVHSQYSYGACTIDYQAGTRVAEDDVYLMLGQLFHVVGYMAFAYLLRGRPVVVANFSSDGMLDLIRQESVTAFMAIGAMLPRMVAEMERDGDAPRTVRIVEYGGAPMGADTIRRAAELFDADLLQAWGMTEFGPGTYLCADAHRRAFSGEKPELLRSCGNATLLSTLAVLDPESGLPVPRDGTTLGELCHRGPNDMIGYWNKPQETADLMRDGWIHTGDGATWDEEGFFYIADRIKSMIISGGENIFPSEIERCLGDHPGISEVVVLGAPDEQWGEVVRAVVVRAPGSSLTAEEVSAYVGGKLASYKKPRIVDFLDELPMTPTGKVNRKLLQ